MTIPATPATPATRAEMDAASTSGTRWRYAAMNLGLVIPAQVSSFFFLYYVDHLKVDPVRFAVLMSAFAVYNAFDNPVIGYLSDRTRTRWGRRIPYLLFATLPTMLFLALLFNAPLFNGPLGGVQNPDSLLLYFGVRTRYPELVGVKS